MDCLSAGTFQEVVDAGNDKQLVTVLLQVDEAFIGIHHLFQVNVLFHDKCKGIFGVVFFVHTDDFFQSHFGLYYDGSEDTAREVTPVGDKNLFLHRNCLQLAE